MTSVVSNKSVGSVRLADLPFGGHSRSPRGLYAQLADLVRQRGAVVIEMNGRKVPVTNKWALETLAMIESAGRDNLGAVLAWVQHTARRGGPVFLSRRGIDAARKKLAA